MSAIVAAYIVLYLQYYDYDSFNYMEKKRDIIWIGTTGVGKTGLATSFLIQAINRGYNGRFITFPELVEIRDGEQLRNSSPAVSQLWHLGIWGRIWGRRRIIEIQRNRGTFFDSTPFKKNILQAGAL